MLIEFEKFFSFLYNIKHNVLYKYAIKKQTIYNINE